MDWRHLLWGTGILALGVFGVFKIQNIQHLKVEIARTEAQLREGQEIWKSHPPLAPEQRENFKRLEDRLFLMLPKEKDIPSLLEEISRLARERSLMDLSFQTGDGVLSPGGVAPSAATAPAVVPPPQPAAPATEAVKPIDSFPVKVTFAGDYREIGTFLGELEKLPRLVKIQSVKINRGVPRLPAEVVIHAYYKNDGLPVAGK